ncbi:MAG: hypothetical protein ACT4OU_07910 [Hyphomicrobium sp.]
MSVKSSSLAACAAAAAVFSASAPAEAYVCKNSPHQAVGVRLLQNAATAASRANWSSSASSQYGLSWSVWNIASNKDVDCVKLNTGKWRCLASANPCDYVVP